MASVRLPKSVAEADEMTDEMTCFAPLFQMREVAPTTAGHIARLPSSVRRKVRLLVGARRLQKAHQLVH